VNALALFFGFVTAVAIIVLFRISGRENAKLPYVLVLISFPIFYCMFALLAGDIPAFINEVVAGGGFILIPLVALKQPRMGYSLLLALACVTHGIYDVFHNHWFVNSGAPLWWPQFCGTVDVIIGLYWVTRFRFYKPENVVTPD